jgi:hypothetical protein
MSGYQKFGYWLDQQNLKKIREDLDKERIPLSEETSIPCRVLRASSRAGLVLPSAWRGFCSRRTSWYEASGKAGKVLIVSNQPLDISGIESRMVITESDFRPDRVPHPGEMDELVQSEVFRKGKPSRWDQIDPAEKDFYQRWFERYRIKEPFDFDQLFRIHSANHANFLDPGFFIIHEDRKVPYSIADSLHTCSSCLEFFNILGEQWLLKYVVPCLGAVRFAHLPEDRYLSVSVHRVDVRKE